MITQFLPKTMTKSSRPTGYKYKPLARLAQMLKNHV